MNRAKSIMLVIAITVTLSSPAFGGTIIGARTNRTGTIIGARTGNIPGARTGNIPGTAAVGPSGMAETRSRFGILLTENIHSFIRLFMETSWF